MQGSNERSDETIGITGSVINRTKEMLKKSLRMGYDTVGGFLSLISYPFVLVLWAE